MESIASCVWLTCNEFDWQVFWVFIVLNYCFATKSNKASEQSLLNGLYVVFDDWRQVKFDCHVYDWMACCIVWSLNKYRVMESTVSCFWLTSSEFDWNIYDWLACLFLYRVMESTVSCVWLAFDDFDWHVIFKCMLYCLTINSYFDFLGS